MGIYDPAVDNSYCHGPGRLVTDDPRTPGPPGPCRGGPHMTQDAWRSSATTDVLFPDDIEGYGPLCVVGEPVDAADTETDTVQYGVVAELDGDHHSEDWLVAPKQMRAIIADAWRPDEGLAAFEVTAAEKDGSGDHAAWIIEGRIIEDGDPL